MRLGGACFRRTLLAVLVAFAVPASAIARIAGTNSTPTHVTGNRAPPPATITLSRVSHETFGCVDPKSAVVINDPRNPRARDPVWIEFMMTRGQCAKVTPFEAWRVVGRQTGLVRLSPAKNTADTVALFVPAADIAAAFIELPPGARPAPPPPIARPVAPPMPPARPAGPGTVYMPEGRSMPDLGGSAPRRQGQSALAIPANPGEAYAAAMRAPPPIPWVLLISGGLALAAMLTGYALLRRKFEPDE